LIAPALLAAALSAPFAAPLAVVDGDTVRGPFGRLRLVAIDAPERGHRAGCLEELVAAERATRRLAELVARGVIVEATGELGRWGLPLVRLRLEDGRTAGAVLVAEGLAVPWSGRRAEWCPRR
jgi:endonuclease YncB( thermonuclease family)